MAKTEGKRVVYRSSRGPLLNGGRMVSSSVVFWYQLGFEFPERGLTCGKAVWLWISESDFSLVEATREALAGEEYTASRPHPGTVSFLRMFQACELPGGRQQSVMGTAVYFLMVYGRMFISLHLLRRVCKVASAALWTLIQGSCRSAWSPEMERIAESSGEGKSRPRMCGTAGPPLRVSPRWAPAPKLSVYPKR